MKIYSLAFLWILSAACYLNEPKEKFPNTKVYNISTPNIIKLPTELNEISGLTFYAKDTSVFGIMDEYGILYKIRVLDGKPYINKWKFGVPGDYEDLVLVDSTFYILKSKGEISEVTFGRDDSIFVEHYKLEEENNEFESLYYDPIDSVLILVCKDCAKDNKKTLSTYRFDLHTHTFSDSSYSIDVSEIADEVNKSKIKFKPSATAYNEVTNQVYLISSINKLLVIADRVGKILEVYPLDPTLYKQPEGMCFSNNNVLIVSNEAADVGAATLLFFKPKVSAPSKR